ncbi:hypothetical protein ACFV23_08425 [Streptomyces sp. NPDC059627]
MNTTASVFDAVRLGYLVVETNRFADRRRMDTNAGGVHRDELGDLECNLGCPENPVPTLSDAGITDGRQRPYDYRYE